MYNFAKRTGIIQKAVKALMKVIANGYRFDEPKSVIEMREKYMNRRCKLFASNVTFNAHRYAYG